MVRQCCSSHLRNSAHRSNCSSRSRCTQFKSGISGSHSIRHEMGEKDEQTILWMVETDGGLGKVAAVPHATDMPATIDNWRTSADAVVLLPPMIMMIPSGATTTSAESVTAFAGPYCPFLTCFWIWCTCPPLINLIQLVAGGFDTHASLFILHA